MTINTVSRYIKKKFPLKKIPRMEPYKSVTNPLITLPSAHVHPRDFNSYSVCKGDAL